MWPNPHFPEDLVAFTEEILYGKLHFLCSVFSGKAPSKKSVQITGKKSCINYSLHKKCDFFSKNYQLGWVKLKWIYTKQ